MESGASSGFFCYDSIRKACRNEDGKTLFYIEMANDGIILEYKKFDPNCDKNLKDTVKRTLRRKNRNVLQIPVS